MNENENTERTPSLREWLRIADFQVAQAFGTAFAAEGLSRRDAMLLRRLSAGPLTTDRDKKLRALEDRGYATQAGDGTWTLTETGRAAADRLNERLDGLHATIRDAVGADEYEALASSLEAVSRALGYEEGQAKPWRGRGGFGGGMPFGPWGPWAGRRVYPNAGRGFGYGPEAGMPPVPPFGPWARRGYAPGYGHGFRPGDGHGFGDGWGHPHHPHGAEYGHHGHGHHDHEHGHGGSAAEAAYERGFAAGFAAHDKD